MLTCIVLLSSTVGSCIAEFGHLYGLSVLKHVIQMCLEVKTGEQSHTTVDPVGLRQI